MNFKVIRTIVYVNRDMKQLEWFQQILRLDCYLKNRANCNHLSSN